MSRFLEMEPNYLKVAEVNYELRIRGLTSLEKVDVDVKRKALRKRLRDEQERGVPVYKANFDFETEKIEINQSVTDIEERLAAFDGGRTEEDRRLRSRITHVLGRLSRLVASEGDDEEAVAAVVEFQNTTTLEVDALDDDRFQKVQGFQRTHIVTRNRITDAPVVAAVASPGPVPRSLPVHKWNLTFDGKNTHFSASSFLQRVEELRVARLTTKEELFDSAVDLFTDQALIWYRSVRTTVTSWDELTAALRRDFLPPDYDDELWLEINKRTQGQHEGVAMYIAVMQNLFGRLSKVPSEEKQIRFIRRNLSPKFQSPLAVTAIESMAELSKICRVVESSLLAQGKYQPPPRRSVALLEPDLAYQPAPLDLIDFPSSSGSGSKSKGKDAPPKGEVASAQVCYKCKKVGHYKRECPLLNRSTDETPKRPICSGCGAVGVIRPNCEKCRPTASKNQSSESE